MRFTSEYYPDIEDITAAQLAAARATVVALLAPAFPDVDLSAGTPTGDLVVAPLSMFLAADDEAHTRLMSDLDLDNVANGVIYSCEFVRRYLGNFAVYDVENAKATGLVRLTFSSGAARTVDRHLLFRFGGTDTFALRMASSVSSVVTLLSAGSQRSTSPDTYVLSQTSGTTWAVDLPLEGVMTAAVTAGAAGFVSAATVGLVGAAAAMDFLPGLQSASLSDLARAARRLSYAVNAGSRYGTTSMVLRNWPESLMVSPVVTGDAELTRTPPGSAMALQAPAVDLYYRSSRDLQTITQTFRLSYVTATVGAGTEERFRGIIPFLHRPSRITSLEWAGTTTTSLISARTIFSRSSVAALQGAQHCGTRFEDFYADITPTLEAGSLASSVPVLEDADGRYGLFTVTYLADPMLSVVAATLEAPDHTTPGVSLLVKSGPLVDVTSLSVTYQKEPGVRVLTGEAADRIAAAFNQAGYPDTLSQTAVHDAMSVAGAKRVVRIQCAATVRVTPASRKFIGAAMTDALPAIITDDWALASDPMTELTVTTPETLVPDTIVETAHADWLENWAATYRTVRHALSADSITFIETP